MKRLVIAAMLKQLLFNCSHYLRSAKCYDDIEKMYGRIFGRDADVCDEEQMLHAVYAWLKKNAESRHEEYVARFEEFIG